MRPLSGWTIAASLFFSISIFSYGYQTMAGVARLAGMGNPAAVERSLSAFASRMGGGAEVSRPVGQATGKIVPVNFREAAPSRLQREKDFVTSQGQLFVLPVDLSGQLGLTDGRSGYQVKALAWHDDDETTHWCEVGTDEKQYMVIAFKPSDGSYTINWLTDVSGTLLRTVYLDRAGSRIVPNSEHAKEFEAQLTFWDSITPPGASVASTNSGS